MITKIGPLSYDDIYWEGRGNTPEDAIRAALLARADTQNLAPYALPEGTFDLFMQVTCHRQNITYTAIIR